MLKRLSDVSQIKINACLQEIVLFVLLIRFVQKGKEIKTLSFKDSTNRSFTAAFFP